MSRSADRARQRFRGLLRRAGDAALREKFADVSATVHAASASSGELLQTNLRSLQDVSDKVDALTGSLSALGEEISAIADRVGTAQASLARVEAIAGAAYDGVAELRRRLAIARRSAEYERAYVEAEPLVTVRIATHNRADLLVGRSVASALSQTYERLEILVVGDGCTDDTADQLAKLGDPRVRFVNQPFRWPYPQDPRRRWLMTGAPVMNVGITLASGSWIAPLDDDDEFTPDHVEALLTVARAGDFELAYGKLEAVLEDAPPTTLGVYPPEHGQFGFQAAVHLAALRDFTLDLRSWLLDEPGDWNLCRRMLEAGVRIGWIDQVVTRYFPSDQHGRRA